MMRLLNLHLFLSLMMLRGTDKLSLVSSEESSQSGKRMLSEMRDIRRLPVTGAGPTSFGSM